MPAIPYYENASGTYRIAVMAEASIPGWTKTRPVPLLTFDEAAPCNTAFLHDSADTILDASVKPSCFAISRRSKF